MTRRRVITEAYIGRLAIELKQARGAYKARKNCCLYDEETPVCRQRVPGTFTAAAPLRKDEWCDECTEAARLFDARARKSKALSSAITNFLLREQREEG